MKKILRRCCAALAVLLTLAAAFGVGFWVGDRWTPPEVTEVTPAEPGRDKGGLNLPGEKRKRILTEEEVLAIQSRKTGALIKASCVLGVIAAGGDEKQVEAARRFADALGLAFQIRDDMLDVIGNEQELGKAVGTDAVKNTFVRLYGLEKCEELVRQYTDVALNALEVFPDRQYLHELAIRLTRRTA